MPRAATELDCVRSETNLMHAKTIPVASRYGMALVGPMPRNGR
jgi:hypothetical protein